MLERLLLAEALDRFGSGGADLGGQGLAPARGGATAGGGPGEAATLLGERKRSFGEIAGAGGGEGGDLFREAAILGQEAIEPGEVARLAGVHQAHELAKGRRRHRRRPLARAAVRILSEKRMAAATAR
jgi:hypothetical protein